MTSGTHPGPARLVRTLTGRAALPPHGSPPARPLGGPHLSRRDRACPVGLNAGRTALARADTDTTILPGRIRTRVRTVTTASPAPQAQAASSAPFPTATTPAIRAPAPGGVSEARAARSAAACARARATTSNPTSTATRPASSSNTANAKATTVAEPACCRPRSTAGWAAPASASPHQFMAGPAPVAVPARRPRRRLLAR
jgi:hypothetical protein